MLLIDLKESKNNLAVINYFFTRYITKVDVEILYLSNYRDWIRILTKAERTLFFAERWIDLLLLVWRQRVLKCNCALVQHGLYKRSHFSKWSQFLVRLLSRCILEETVYYVYTAPKRGNSIYTVNDWNYKFFKTMSQWEIVSGKPMRIWIDQPLISDGILKEKDTSRLLEYLSLNDVTHVRLHPRNEIDYVGLIKITNQITFGSVIYGHSSSLLYQSYLEGFEVSSISKNFSVNWPEVNYDNSIQYNLVE